MSPRFFASFPFFFRALLATELVLFSVAGCHKRETPAEEGARTGTLLLGNGAEPRDLDPQVDVAYTDYNILVALFEGLTVIDETTSKPIPGIAERWDISPDGLVYTFHLRSDARWSDGAPVTAGDFVFSFERILSPQFGAEYANMLFAIKNAEAYNAGKLTDFSQVGAKALDPRTLQITLEHPTPYLLSLAAHQAWFPVDPAVILKFGKAHDRGTRWTLPGNFVGDGPFTLEEWSPDQRIVVKKNPLYYGAAQNRLNRVIFYPVADPLVDENNFRAGQVHVTNDLLPDHLDAWRARAPGSVRVDPFLQTFFLRFNVTRPPFTDPRVRRALARAIDREAIARSVMQGTCIPAYSLVPPDTAGYTSTARVPTDFDAARRLLAEAGYPGGKGFPKVSVTMNADPVNTRIFEAIQQMWRRELGIDITLTTQEYRVYVSSMQSLSFDMLRSRWIGDYDDPSTFTDLFTSDSGNNDTGWKNPAYDQLIATASAEQDTARRFALLQKAESLLLNDAPIAPIFYGARVYLISPEVKGWVPALLGTRRYQTIHLEP